MKELTVSVLLCLSLLCFNIQSVSADSVAVDGDLVFITGSMDAPLVVKNISTGAINQCIAAPYLDPLGHDVTDRLGTAKSVKIADYNAVVTVETITDTGTFNDIVVVDAASCFMDVERPVSVSECYSTVDLDAGLLIIPCVEIEGDVITVHMSQRGKSSNWEVSFLGANRQLGDVIETDGPVEPVEETDDGNEL